MLHHLGENLWLWIVLAFFVLAVGLAIYSHRPSWKLLLGTIGVAVAIFGVGLILHHTVETDRKGIIRMLDGLADALEADDLDRVLGFISPDAQKTQEQARTNLAIVRLTRANYTDFKLIESRPHDRPLPTADITFTAIVRGTVRRITLNGLDGQFGPVRVFFRIEVEKGADGKWRITDNCEFTPTAYHI